MYIIVVTILIKEGHNEEYIEAMLENARGSVNNEPGCHRFDVIQDGGDPNRIWLYEIYDDEAAFKAHTQAPHYFKWRDTVKDWMDEKPHGAGMGSHNIWPPDGKLINE